ncbi:MAG: histidine kinase [Pelagibacterium sp. SCN 63-23]|nr:MAG: histidine kinase [Pelagibacterium sp. SCN 63-23]
MQAASKTVVRSTSLLLLVGLIALLGIVGTTIWLVERTQTYFDVVLQARATRAAVVDLRALLQDAETSQRGYIITLDPDYLAPYNAALPQIGAQIAELEKLLLPVPSMQLALDQLRRDIDTKLSEMARTITLAGNEQRSEAASIIRSNEGKEAMDRARAFFVTAIGWADARLNEGVLDQRNTANLLRIVSIIGALVIFAVVGGAIYSVLNYTRRLAEARRAIEAANGQLEQRVRERTIDLRKANEEVQRFAYIVTHDLRAPLVNIMGFTSEMETSVAAVKAYIATHPPDQDDMLAKEAHLAAEEDLPEAISFVRAATRKMDRLINAILKISREGRRQLRPETVDLGKVIEAAAAAVHHQLVGNGGEIATRFGIGDIVTDRLSIEQVVTNIIDNAIKYRQPGRPLRVEVDTQRLAGGRVAISIKDNGRGIAAADHERIFELFRRSGSPAEPGEGIGLPHVRGMVRSMGGDVTVASALDEGSTFTITLPRDMREFLRSSDA